MLLVPATRDTAGLVDADFLAAMKDGALLVNAARGGVVDTGALLAELEKGRLLAALDVTDPEPLPRDHPLWTAPGCSSPRTSRAAHRRRGGARCGFSARSCCVTSQVSP
nr:hypothetical protein GCM10020093_056280 [Planobispora longispora]